ncbi:hypothetical protein [Streptomyces sp. VNUA24]|uniref:hypothetical protein n=1 Tax=Streptomyces sp. VNUA24 TaxID=3031131 RepID=UPI0023B7AA1C|nr:hypothetical protein [Streptomyces sp. VNUA24]WEH18487.1 hypothetical protein PYR72_34385 [Streptomyces sp. VNUA24]
MATLLMVGLAACSEESSADNDGSSGSDATTVAFNPSQLSQALPSKIGAPQGWRGKQPVLYEGAEAQKQCGYQELSCAGLTSLGSSVYYPTSSSDTNVRFTLAAYDTVDNAKVGMKTLVASVHEDEGDSLKTLSIQAGADQTEAFADDDSSSAILRVGTIVSYVAGIHVSKPDDLQMLATMQVDRIKTSATGKNPDA